MTPSVTFKCINADSYEVINKGGYRAGILERDSTRTFIFSASPGWRYWREYELATISNKLHELNTATPVVDPQFCKHGIAMSEPCLNCADDAWEAAELSQHPPIT